MVSGFASERRPASPGTASGIASEYPSGFNRISHQNDVIVARFDIAIDSLEMVFQ